MIWEWERFLQRWRFNFWHADQKECCVQISSNPLKNADVSDRVVTGEESCVSGNQTPRHAVENKGFTLPIESTRLTLNTKQCRGDFSSPGNRSLWVHNLVQRSTNIITWKFWKDYENLFEEKDEKADTADTAPPHDAPSVHEPCPAVLCKTQPTILVPELCTPQLLAVSKEWLKKKDLVIFGISCTPWHRYWEAFRKKSCRTVYGSGTSTWKSVLLHKATPTNR